MKKGGNKERIGFPTLKETLQDCFNLNNKAIKKLKNKYPKVNFEKELK